MRRNLDSGRRDAPRASIQTVGQKYKSESKNYIYFFVLRIQMSGDRGCPGGARLAGLDETKINLEKNDVFSSKDGWVPVAYYTR